MNGGHAFCDLKATSKLSINFEKVIYLSNDVLPFIPLYKSMNLVMR